MKLDTGAIASMLATPPPPVPKLDTGATAWMLAATALVLLMTPGLAFFYGGMTRAKSVLNMMMMSFVSIITVSVVWVFFGYSVAFTDNGNTTLNKFIGGFGAWGLRNLYDPANKAAASLTSTGWSPDGQQLAIPTLVFAAFQLTFAIITVALISGAIADRTKFGSWVIFTVAWASLVYIPVAHWVWGNGWLHTMGIEDFAGGTVVHVNAGAAGLALAFVLGKRKGWPKEPMRPHNLGYTLLGVALLWFGWFGFNAGSQVGADGTAGLAFMNTQLATAVAAGAWIVVEKLRDGHATTLGCASGAVAGLVAITPACAFINPWAAVLLGAVVGSVCAYAVGLKYKFGYDDSLDVVGVHMVGGAVGALSLGFLAVYPSLPGQEKGLLYGGHSFHQLGTQALGPVAVGVYSFVMAWIIGQIIDKTIGFRVSEDDEVSGIDLAVHAETAYDLSPGHGGAGVLASVSPKTAPDAKVEADA